MTESTGSDTRVGALEIAGLVVLLALYSWLCLSFFALDHDPLQADEAVHLRDAVVFHDILGDPTQLTPHVIKALLERSDAYPLLRPSGYYPPLAPLVAAAVFLFTSPSVRMAIVSNQIFVLLLVVSVFLTARKLFGRAASWAATLFVLLSPMALEHATVFMLDLPLAAFTALAFLALLHTDGFARRRASILFGVACGLGILVKWTFGFFLVAPILALVLRPGTLRHWRHLLLAAAAATVVFGPYYFPILGVLIEKILFFKSGPIAQAPGSKLSLESAAFYGRVCFSELMTPAGCLLVLVGVATVAMRRHADRILLLAALLGPYLVLTFVVEHRTPRYFLPFLGFAALAAGALFRRSNPASLRASAAVILAGAALLFGRHALQRRQELLSLPDHDWGIPAIVAAVENELREPDPTQEGVPSLAVIPVHTYINAHTLRFYLHLRRIPVNVVKVQDYRPRAEKRFAADFERYRLFLTKDRPNIGFPAFQSSIDAMQRTVAARASALEGLLEIAEPDASTVRLSRRNPLRGH